MRLSRVRLNSRCITDRAHLARLNDCATNARAASSVCFIALTVCASTLSAPSFDSFCAHPPGVVDTQWQLTS
jgi:hypothetical protein